MKQFYKILCIATSLLLIESCQNYELFRGKGTTLISGTYQKGKTNVTEPRAVESEFFKVRNAGIVIMNQQAGFYLIADVKKFPEKDLYIVVEYEYPGSGNEQNDAIFSSSEEKKYYLFSSPTFVRYLRIYSTYDIKVTIYESKNKKKIIDSFTQKVRSYVDTTTNQIYVKKFLSY